jgi:ribulose-phosphate 3-epimerase
MQIVPSIASANLLEIGREMERAGRIGYLHLDIEDGNFSPDITFGVDMVRAIAGATRSEMDAHLMVTNPGRLIGPLCDCGVSRIAVHIEATEYPSEPLLAIRARGKEAGLALNYKTGIEALEPYLDQIDYVLLQTCEAGDESLSFRQYAYEKIRKAKALLPKGIPLWADGGINETILSKLADSGLDFAVIGRALFGSADLAETCRKMQAACVKGAAKHG